MLAAASIITAANGLLGPASTCDLQLVERLHLITAIEAVCINPVHAHRPIYTL